MRDLLCDVVIVVVMVMCYLVGGSVTCYLLVLVVVCVVCGIGVVIDICYALNGLLLLYLFCV